MEYKTVVKNTIDKVNTRVFDKLHITT